MNTRRRITSAGSALLLAAMVAGCASHGSASAGGGSASDGGTLKIALSNMDTGNVSFPAVTAAAKVAVQYLNAEKGGIAGRQVELVTCDLKNENEAGQKCGQEIANDPGIAFGLVGMTNYGAPYYSAMKSSGKATLLGLAITPVDDTAVNTVSYLTGASGTFVGYADYVKEHGYKSVAYINHDDASMKAAFETFRKALDGSGIAIKQTVIPSSASDILPQVSASEADKADVVIVQSAGKCPGVAQAFASLGWKPAKVLTGGACLPATKVAETPALFDGWSLLGPIKLTAAGPDSDPDVKLFLDKWSQYDTSGQKPGVYAELGWSVVMNAAAALEKAKPAELTAATAEQAFLSYTGPAVLGSASIKCPGPPAAPVACAQELVGYSISGGTLTLEK